MGEDNDPFPAKSGENYAIKVDGITPPKLKPLAEVRADAAGGLDRRTAPARRWTKRPPSWPPQATADSNLAAIAKEMKMPVQQSPALTPQHHRHDFLRRAGGENFRAPRRAAWWKRPRAAAPTSLSPRSPASPIPRPRAPDFQGGRAQLSQQAASDISVSFANAARLREGVKINQQMLQSALGSK